MMELENNVHFTVTEFIFSFQFDVVFVGFVWEPSRRYTILKIGESVIYNTAN